jgi:leader peptidase (prepilin peptidase)/N-methyltransferase
VLDSATITAIVVTFVGAFGLLIGSFLNVVVYRVPAGKSIVSPPSSCPNCGAGIRPYDNIPVISWLVLRGKCRDCGNPISARYPLVELATGILFAVTSWRFSAAIIEPAPVGATIGAILVLVAFLYLAAIGVALLLIDVDTHRLPDALVLPSYIVGGVLLLGAAIASGDWDAALRALIGAVALFVAYYLMAFAYPGGMGFGDVKLAGVLGLYLGWLGWGTLIVGAFSAFLLGGVFSIALLITRRATRKSGIPFGPWMIVGAFLGIFFGEQLWAAYFGLVGLV